MKLIRMNGVAFCLALVFSVMNADGSENPCQNGGTCTPDVNPVNPCVCQCPPGFGGDVCETKLKIVREVIFYTACGTLPTMSMNYYEGDCMRVEPVDAESYQSKTATCYQENGNWYVHVTKFYDNDCLEKKAEYNARANGSCYQDPEEGIGNTYWCVDTLPQRCSAATCLYGGACVEGTPHEYCEQCPEGTFGPRCFCLGSSSGYPLYTCLGGPPRRIAITQYSGSDTNCTGPPVSQTGGEQGSCLATADGRYAEYYAFSQGVYVQPYLDSECSLPTSYYQIVGTDKCVPGKGSYWKFHPDTPCDSWECLMGGQCIVVEGSPQCNCPAGVTGPHCEDGNPCPGWCLNGGQCFLDEKWWPQCNCPAGFTGLHCEKKKLTVPPPPFFWTTQTGRSYAVRFKANKGYCPPDDACFYRWNFGDGHSGAGASLIHTFENAATRTVILTVTARSNGLSVSYAVDVTPNGPPVVSHSPVSLNLYTVRFIDTSTDDDILPDGAVTVKWGDRTESTGNAGEEFSHTYTRDGRFMMTHSVKDSSGVIGRERISVSVP